ncbi:hypothetical protein GCM10027288_10310 [Bordetella tumbae]
MATTGLVAHVLVAKYADHLPLYRQEAIVAHRVMHADETPVQTPAWQQEDSSRLSLGICTWCL